MKIELYKPLIVSSEKFHECYNLPIEDLVDRHTFKETAQSRGGNSSPPILYLSYSHAIRLFRMHFPGWDVDFVRNENNSEIWRETDDRGYFLLPYVHDGERRSAPVHFGILNSSGAHVGINDTITRKNGEVVPTADQQLFNKSVYRAIVKAIAIVTGIGLKLWTGEDLSAEIIDEKLLMISRVNDLATKYKLITGSDYKMPELNYMSSVDSIKAAGKELSMALKMLSEKKPELSPVSNHNVEVESVTVEVVDEATTPTTAAKKKQTKQ